ncbi:MAG: S8 family serine peptidase [Oscillospiraceae bacterium]|nr:S8 family serine peptidase [Oscillospiraceae bacterium]
MKRVLALALCLCMVLGLMPVLASAEPAPQQTTVTAQELPGTSRLDGVQLPQKEAHRLYADDETVTVLVELQEQPLIAGFVPKDGGGVGLQMSEYLTAAAPEAAAMKARQDEVVSLMAKAVGMELTVQKRYVNAVNAVSLRIPYGKLDELRAVEGVKTAHVQRIFDRPVTTAGISAEGTHGYSYDMTGLESVWNAGYTGQGMLVAVMDTGLDLNYTTWGDFQTGVRRVHEAFTDDSFKSELNDAQLRYTNGSLARFLQSQQLIATTGIDGQKITYGNNDLYKNRKVPYAADYADGDLNVMPMDSDHGTHVAGTIAGYAETEEGEVLFSGVAPDAQLMIMKVFPDSADSGAEEAIILAALEDALLLGADVINLSLGSDNGWADDDTVAGAAYKRVNEAGISLMISAGNSAESTAGNHYGEHTLTADPEVSMISSPAVYGSGLAVASAENAVTTQSVLFWAGTDGVEHKAVYLDPHEIAMKASLGEGSWNVIPVDGYGTYEDYEAAGFRNYSGSGEKGESGIALVKRGGGISFADKINAATQFSWSYYDYSKGSYVTEYPVKAVIIYDEDPNATELIYMSADSAMLTSCFIAGKDGHALAAAAESAIENGTYANLRVSMTDEIIESDTAGQMSVFSSWGAGPALELKPEITAPGGNIWSALIDRTYSPADPSGVYDDYTGAYGMMSGTSMAAPHMAGIALLVRQAVMEQYGLTSKTAVAEMSEHLMVSTAVPLTDENGVYYAPRYQGAGLVNAAAAITTPAFISVQGQSVGKLELKDDPQRTGTYELTFQINNISDRDVTYAVSATLTRPDTDVFASQWGEVDVALNRNVVILDEALGEVTVPAGQTVTFSQTVTLSAEEKAAMDEKFPNGTYVEGFIGLTAEHEPRIGLPVLAFYGDWTAAPIFDRSLWYETPADGENLFNNPSTMGNTFIGGMTMAGYVNLGQNAFDPMFGEQALYHTENFSLSPNGDGVLDSINDFVLYQLREAKLVVVEVHDADTGELYYRDYAAWQFKSLYYAAYGYAIPASQFYFTNSSWDGTDLDGNTLPSGTNCTMTVTAWGDGDYGEDIYVEEAGRMVTDFEAVAEGRIVPTFNGHAMDLTGDVLSFPVVIDTVAPKLRNNTVSFYTEDGRTYMTGTVYDVDGSIASVEIHPYVKRTHKQNPDYFGWDIDQLNPFYTEHVYDAAAKTLTFTCDVTEYAHTNESWEGEGDTYSFEWDGTVFLSCGDYGLNDRTYVMKVDTGSGLLLSQTSALMYVGGEFELSVIDNTGIDGELVRTSSNPEVATVDEFGKIKAIGPGQTTITISKGDREAVCIVAVREPNPEIVDFNLSIDHFSGLKPNGSVIVKVTDLQPANAVIEDVRWEINEDDPDLYVGLVNVVRYDTTGLVGEIFLNYTATGDPEIHVPGASATLDVTLNGVTRSMTIDWTDLYTYSDEDDLVSDLPFFEQTLYIPHGETAELTARYANAALHESSSVKLYTAEGYIDYDYNNVTAPAMGLKLDGPDFCTAGNVWSGRLVNEAGFALPERIRVFTRYSYGYEYEMTNSWRTDFDYDPETGEINVYYPPETSTSELVIRADGVKSPGAPAGTVIGGDWQRPESVYGPFDWEILEGSGELTTGSTTDYYGTEINCAWFVPAEPGLSIIRATTRDGSKSVNFAVVSEPVLAEKLTLSQKELTLSVGQTGTVDAVLTPEPTLEKHAHVKWESFDPGVASVDPDTGLITAVSEGYAYIRVYTDVERTLETTCIVHVVPCVHGNTITETVEATCTADGSVTVKCNDCGHVISKEILPGGHDYESAVTEPTCTEAGFTTYTCRVCGESHTADEVAALGHSYEHIHVEASCTAPGYDQYICTVCGYTYADSFVAATECPSTAFADVAAGDWFHAAVDYVVSKGLMNGMDATHFGPTATTNRAQVVTVLYRMAGSPDVEGELPFTDVSEGDWYRDAVLWAVNNGITNGMDATHFAPGTAINRAQLVTFLYRFAKAEGEVDTSVLDRFADGAALPAFCRDSFAWAIENGLIDGMDGMLNANGTANRAQLATVLMRYDSLNN